MKKNRKGILLFVGLMMSSISQITSHFTQLPDFVSGLTLGIGIGIMLLAFAKPKSNAASEREA